MLGENPETGATTLTLGNLKAFYDLPSIAIVLGGTSAALLVSYPLEFFKKIPKHFKLLFKHEKNDPK